MATRDCGRSIAAARRRGRAAAGIGLLALLAGCGAIQVRDTGPPPAASFRDAQPVGYDAVRFFADRPTAAVLGDVRDRWAEVRAAWIARGRPKKPIEISFLILSGGAADGAFGVGLLNGWSEAGGRPEFRAVTGVSTGALIAPYAFLGSDYDEALRETFLSPTGNSDLFEPALFSALRGALSLADSGPLRRRIQAAITPDMVDRIAAESAKGRRLVIGTTHLDARRPVVWDLTAIAASGQPDREALIEKILLASASIPGLAPPVRIRVSLPDPAGGAPRIYEELHVDGGVSNTLVFASPSLSLRNPYEGELPVRSTVYVVQNNKLFDSYRPIRNSLSEIVQTSVSEMIRSQARGDQVRVYFQAQRDGLKYRLAQVPQDFRVEEQEGEFDPRYLRALYDLAYGLARNGYPWRTAPPGYDPNEIGENGAAAQPPVRRAGAAAPTR